MAEKNITIKQKNELGQLDTFYPKTIAAQVIESSTKMFLTDTDKAKYDANTSYTNATPIVEPIGGIEAGDTFDDVAMSDLMDQLLYPYVKPEITGTASVASRVVEKGVTTSVTYVDAVVVKKSDAITKVELFNNATSVEAKTESVEAGGTFRFSQTISISDTSTLKVKATDETGVVVEAEAATYTYVYPMYNGTCAAGATLTSADIVAMTKHVVEKGNESFTFNLADTCAVIAYPASYGDLVAIRDDNGFNNIANFTKSVIAVTGTDATSQNYNVYVKEPATATGFKFTIEF